MILNEQQILIRETARAFARDRLLPNAAAWDRDKKTPRSVFTEMGELGLLGMLAPEKWGGVEAGHVSFVLAMEEIAAGDGGVSTTMSVHNGVATMPIVQYGSEQQKQRFLPALTSGETIGAFALSEATAGSDAANLKCSAKRDGDHYVLNGSKLFISSGVIAGVVIVFAVTDPAAGKKGYFGLYRADGFARLFGRCARAQTGQADAYRTTSAPRIGLSDWSAA